MNQYFRNKSIKRVRSGEEGINIDALSIRESNKSNWDLCSHVLRITTALAAIMERIDCE